MPASSPPSKKRKMSENDNKLDKHNKQTSKGLPPLRQQNARVNSTVNSKLTSTVTSEMISTASTSKLTSDVTSTVTSDVTSTASSTLTTTSPQLCVDETLEELHELGLDRIEGGVIVGEVSEEIKSRIKYVGGVRVGAGIPGRDVFKPGFGLSGWMLKDGKPVKRPLRLSTGNEEEARGNKGDKGKKGKAAAKRNILTDGFYVRGNLCAPPAGPNHFELLSDELVIHVFRFLPKSVLARVAPVCKRFRNLAADEVFWRRLDLGLRTLPPGAMGVVLQRGVVVMRAARATIQSPAIVKKQEDVVSKLQYLDLSVASIKIDDTEAIIGACNNLRKLAMEMCQISTKLCQLISLNGCLNTLDLALVEGITSEGLFSILTNCRFLRELNLAWTEMSDKTVAILAQNIPKSIERLNISGCRDTLKDTHVETIVNRCANLQELDVSDCLTLTSRSLNAIIRDLPRIESLSTSRCYNITPVAYLNLEESSSLCSLNVFGVLKTPALVELKTRLSHIEINKFMFSSVARPTVGVKRTAIWGFKVRE